MCIRDRSLPLPFPPSFPPPSLSLRPARSSFLTAITRDTGSEGWVSEHARYGHQCTSPECT
eukprot:2337922-Rhodomonas_salina.1